MIAQLIIKNYQSHKNSTLDFSDGVNVITGKSDSGKTAILRALRWLITNRPGGDSFRSTWGGDTEVAIITSEGNAITRAKNKENLYQLNDIRFVAFATDIPKEIGEVLNISDINLQRQFDMPFLLNDSAGEVASHFNKIAHLEKIDSSTKKVQSLIRELEQSVKSDEYQIEKANVELLLYAHLEKMEIELEVLEQMEKDTLQEIKQWQKLSSLIFQINNITSDIESMSFWFDMEIDVDALLELSTKKEEIDEQKNSLIALHSAILDNEAQIEGYAFDINNEKVVDFILALMLEKEQIIKDRNKIKRVLFEIGAINNDIQDSSAIINADAKVQNLLSIYQDLEKVEKDREKLGKLIDTIEYSQTIQMQAEGLIVKLQTRFENSMGNTCPLCEQSIPHNHEK